MFGLVPRPVHAILDYVWSLLFLAAPHLFGFAGDKSAVTFSRIVAGGTLTMSLCTRYELGVIRVIPFNVHLILDTGSALLGLAGPALLGFSTNRTARNTVLAFTITEIGVLLLSKSDPRGK